MKNINKEKLDREKRMLIVDELVVSDANYLNYQFSFSKYSLNKVIEALQCLCQKHSILRSGIQIKNNRSLIVEYPEGRINQLESKEAFTKASKECQNEEKRPLFEIRERNNEIKINFIVYHALFDGFSLELLLKNLKSFLENKEISDELIDESVVSGFENFLTIENLPVPEEGIYFPKKSKEEISFRFKNEHLETILDMCKELKLSLAGGLFLTTQLIFSRVKSKVEVSTVYPQNIRTKHQNKMGYFVNTVPLVSSFDSEKTVKDNILQSVPNYYKALSSGNKISDETYQLNSKFFSRPDIFISYLEKNASGNYGIKTIKSLDLQFPLMVEFEKDLEELEVTARYNEEIFSNTYEFKSFFECLKYVLLNFEATKNIFLKDIYIPDKRIQTNYNFAEYEGMIQALEKNATLYPNSLALIFNDEKLSYFQLWEKLILKSSELKLLGLYKVTVALDLSNRTEYILTVLAMLKNKCTFVPVLGHPIDRKKDIIESSQATYLINDTSVIKLNENRREADTGYIIFTSGTTGTPKGVVIDEKALINSLLGIGEKVNFNIGDSFVFMTNITFDISLLEFLLPLYSGGYVIIPHNNLSKNPLEFSKELNRYRASFIQGTSTTFEYLLNSGWEHSEDNIMVGGEPFNNRLALLANEFNHIFNMYGPTESTIWITVKEIFYGEENISCGNAIQNVDVIIWKNGLQLPGSLGEVCIAGQSLFEGYINTDSKESVFEFQGKRYYKTGDIGYLDFGDNLYISGREDSQVKIGGKRVELGEIEKVLEKNKQSVISKAVVKFLENEIVAFIDVEVTSVEISETKEYLSKTLPPYMIPNYFIFMPEFPVNSNGKVDRKSDVFSKLFKEKWEVNIERNTKQKTDLLLKLWYDTTHIRVKPEENIFSTEIDSLKMLKFLNALEKEYHVELNISDVYRAENLRNLNRQLVEVKKVGNVSFEVFKNMKQHDTNVILFGTKSGKLNSYADLINALIKLDVNLFGYSFNENISIKNTVEEIREHLESFVKRNDKNKYILIGYSLGGNILQIVTSQISSKLFGNSKGLIIDSSPLSVNDKLIVNYSEKDKFYYNSYSSLKTELILGKSSQAHGPLWKKIIAVENTEFLDINHDKIMRKENIPKLISLLLNSNISITENHEEK